MVILTRAVWCAPRVAAFALILTFGVLPARANESSIWAALERPDDAFLLGLQGCGHALGDGTSRGSECLVGWSVDHILLDALTRFATEQGQTVFGEHFRIVNNLSYSPYGSGLSGGLDVVVPLASSTTSGAAPSKSNAFFLQQGVTRWVDDHGSDPQRHPCRCGSPFQSIRRKRGMSDVVGVSAFVQQSREFQHTRLVTGADYAGKWGRGSLNLFVPTTGWVPSHAGYKERALAGNRTWARV